MSAASLDQDLRTFAVQLFEHSGGVADWPESDVRGSVLLPAGVAAAAQLPEQEFALDTQAAPHTLQVGLAGEFLDVAYRVLEAAIPRQGEFRIEGQHLTSRELSDKVSRTFIWQNARAKCAAAEPASIEYHAWTLHASLRSEDVWESVIRLNVNSESQAIVELPNLFHESDIRPGEMANRDETPTTYATAVSEGRRRLVAQSSKFVHRIEQRLERDRKRLQSYYRALAREAAGPRRRTAHPLTAEEIAGRRRAVDLELRRKLAELNENYALRANLHALTLARVRLPVFSVPIVIQRKQAFRDYRLTWNAITKQFEPLSCSRCRRATFSATFTNDDVDLLCTACAEA